MGAAITPYQSLLAVHAFGIPPRFYSVILVLAALASVGSAVVFGILSDQYARRRQMAITLSTAMVLGCGLILLLPSAGSFTLAHALLLPIGMALFGQLFVQARILTQRRPAAERDTVSALIRAIFAIPYFVVLPLWTLALKAVLALARLARRQRIARNRSLRPQLPRLAGRDGPSRRPEPDNRAWHDDRLDQPLYSASLRSRVLTY